MLERALLDGKYRVEREIGRGSSGVVLESTDLALDRRVAIKIGPADPPRLKARFLREGRAAAGLQSKHVVQVHRVGELPDGRPYMVMDLLEGRTFAAAIATEGAVDPKRAIEWTLQVLDALGEAHAAGLVHRDVKPSNLFLADRAGRSPIVKVLDFGLVKDAADERLTQTGEGFGTPSYVAPEQIRDASRSDARSDVWAVGVTLFELLTGKLPFDGDGVGGLLAAIANAPTPPMPGVSPRLVAIVEKCLAKRPADRYGTAAALARALEAVRPKAKKARRSPALFVASVLGGMVVASVVAFVIWRRATSSAFAGGWPHWPVTTAAALPASSAAPAPQASVATPAHAMPPEAPIVVEVESYSGIRDPDRWLRSVRNGLVQCARESGCRGRDMRLVVGKDGVHRSSFGCPPTEKSLTCFRSAVPAASFDPEALDGGSAPFASIYIK